MRLLGSMAQNDLPMERGSLHISPIFIWLLIQLVALGAGAFAIPIWPLQPAPRDGLAVYEIVAVQIIASGLLFPSILQNAGSALAITLISWPFIQLGGLLSNIPQANLIAASFFITIWIAGLAGWAKLLPRMDHKLAAVAIVSLFSMGGPLLGYFRLEAGKKSWHGEQFSPVTAAFELIYSNVRHSSEAIWIVLPGIFVCTLAANRANKTQPPTVTHS